MNVHNTEAEPTCVTCGRKESELPEEIAMLIAYMSNSYPDIHKCEDCMEPDDYKCQHCGGDHVSP